MFQERLLNKVNTVAKLSLSAWLRLGSIYTRDKCMYEVHIIIPYLGVYPGEIYVWRKGDLITLTIETMYLK